MSVTTRYFRGKAFTVPGAYSDEDDDGGLVQPPIGVVYPLIIGPANGGNPNTVLRFASPQDAQNQLRSGPLLDAVKRCFSPFQDNTPEGDTAPFLVYGIRLGDATISHGPTQSTLKLYDANPVAQANEVQTATITGTPTGGTFTLSFNGQTTAGIAYNAASSAVQTAFTGLSTVGAGNATVAGSTGGPYTITFTGALAATDVPTVVSSASGLTGGTSPAVNIAVQTPGSPGPKAVITALSADYGAYTNGMRVTVDAGSLYGYKVTFARDAANGVAGGRETFDNVFEEGINLLYIGAGTAVALTVNATALTTTVSGASADNLNIPFASYPTLQSVVDRINGQGTYIASVVNADPTSPSNVMDWLTAANILSPLSIVYTGSGSTATGAIVTTTTGNQLQTTTSITGDNLAISLDDNVYPSLNYLALAISGITANADGSYTGGTVVTSGSAPNRLITYTGSKYTVVLHEPFWHQSVENLSLSSLGDIKTGAVNVPGSFDTTQSIQAVVDHLNEYYSPLLTATRVAGSGTFGLATSPNPTYFTGAIDALTNTLAWTSALTLAQTVDAQLVVCLTPDPIVHRSLRVHCSVMSAPDQRRERVGICGGDTGESILDAISRAQNLGSLQDGDLIQVLYPGITDVDFNGNAIVVPPYVLAAQKAGLNAALGVGKSATNKFLKSTGVETKLTRSQLADLIMAGVTPIENVEVGLRRGVRITKDITTYISQPNFIKHLFGTRLAAHAVRRVVRERCEELIGQPNDKNFELRLRNRVETTLDNLTTMGLLVAGDKKAAWRNIVIDRDTDTVRIDFEASVVTEVDFIFITAHLDVFRRGD